MTCSLAGYLLVAGESAIQRQVDANLTYIRIIVYSPQFIENYQLKSGEGLSVAFILVWLIGDISNLLGAILAHLLPTVILLAVYVRDSFI